MVDPTRAPEGPLSMLEAEGIWKVTAFDENGVEQWTDEVRNKIVNEGLNWLINAAYVNGQVSSAQYIGLTNGSPTIAAADTMSSKAWSENQNYSEGTRQLWNKTGGGTGSAGNATNKAIFNINASTTVGGIFLTTSNVKGSTGTQTLFSVIALSGGNAALQNGWTLQIEYQLTFASVT